jgi:hypothetical protein
MSTEKTFVVDEKVLQDAKDKWNKHLARYGNKVTVSFDEMFNFFDTCISYSEIAEKIGVSREYVRQIYNKYFCKIFGESLIKDKQKEGTKEKKKLSHEKIEKELFSKKPFSSIVGSAKLAGCDVHITSSNENGHVKLKQLLVNGHLCSLKTMSTSFTPPGGTRSFVHASVGKPTDEKIRFIIFYYKVKGFPERIFVVSYKIIEDIFFKSKNKKRVDINIPTKKCPVYNNRIPLLDWWKYENAWHLIT